MSSLRNYFSIFLVATILACTHTPLTAKGAQVKQLDETLSECQKIGDAVESDIMNADFNVVKSKLKNKTAELGGNAFVITEYLGRHLSFHATVLKCPEN